MCLAWLHCSTSNHSDFNISNWYIFVKIQNVPIRMVLQIQPHISMQTCGTVRIQCGTGLGGHLRMFDIFDLAKLFMLPLINGLPGPLKPGYKLSINGLGHIVIIDLLEPAM